MTDSEANTRKRPFYGWFLVGVGTFCYGFSISPGYYSWGFFAPELIADLGLTRQQVGDIFGVRGLVASGSAALVGLALNLWGLRRVVPCGALVGALGCFLVSRADSLAQLYWAYGVIMAFGVSFASVLPAQTLAMNWFERYRARATAIIFIGGAVVGTLITPFDAFILRIGTWRDGWLVIGAIMLSVAVVGALFLRNRPEDMGLERDGGPTPTNEGDRASIDAHSREQQISSDAATSSTDSAGASIPLETADSVSITEMTAADAVRTPQFYALTFIAIVNAVPWSVFSVHGRLHFEDLGFSTTLAAALLGLRVGVSTLGRLAGSAGDFVSATKLLAAALLIAALGLVGLLFATAPPLAYASVVLLGIGYGTGFICIPVAFGDYFGRRAFAASNGLRITLVGVALWLAPRWTGAAADATGTYDSAFMVIAGLCVAGAAVSLLTHKPSRPLVQRHERRS